MVAGSLTAERPKPATTEKAAWVILLGVLVSGPLLFGAVHEYAYTAVITGALIGASLVLFRCIRKEENGWSISFQIPLSVAVAFFGFLFLLIAFQIVYLPAFLTRLLSPEAWVIAAKSRGVPPPEGLNPASLAVYRYPVRMALVRFSTYGLFFFSLVQLLNSKKRIETAVFVLLFIASFEALYGLAQAFSGSGRIWWFSKSVYGSVRDVTGTYINRNHFAGLMEMLLVLIASYLAALSRDGGKAAVPIRRKGGMLRRIFDGLSLEQRWNKRLFIVLLGVLAGVGLIFSASRGGIIAAACALLCMSLFFFSDRTRRRQRRYLLLLCLAASAYALYMGVAYPVERFKDLGSGLEDRTRLALSTLDLFADYRLTGVGVGNFEHAYPKYQSVEDTGKFIRYAHNDWAQFMAEAGIIGVFLLLSCGGLWLYQFIRLWRSRSDSFAVGLAVAAPAAVTAAAVHAYSDFNLHIPANFLVLTAILAVGSSAVCLKRRRGGDRFLARRIFLPIFPWGIVFLSVLLGLIGWNAAWTMRHFVAECYCSTVHNSTFNRDRNPPLQKIERAIAWDPWNAAYWYKLAMERKRLHRRSDEPGRAVEKAAAQGRVVEAIETAARLNPLSGEYHLRLGWEYAYMWLAQPAAHHRWLSAADAAMERAAYLSGPAFPHAHLEMGNYWMMRSKTLPEAGSQWSCARQKALWHYGVSLAPGFDRRRIHDEIRKNIAAHYPGENIERQVAGF